MTTRRSKQLPRCPACGGTVRLLAKAGRVREFRRGVQLPIPDDFEIPTCTNCGEEMMSLDVSQALDARLQSTFLEEQAAGVHFCVSQIVAREKVTQGQIEDACGVTRSYLSHLMSGKREASQTLLKLLELFALSDAAFAYGRKGVPFYKDKESLSLGSPRYGSAQRYRTDNANRPQARYAEKHQ